MRQKREMRYRIVRKNLLMMIPLFILFSCASLTAIYSLMRNATVDLLTNESQNSQIYLMEQLSHQWEYQDQKRELRASAPTFCKTLSDSLELRVQIYSHEGDLLGDSSLTAGMQLTNDVTEAIAGTKAYTFFLEEGRPYISFSSPIYQGNLTLGAVRYLSHQEDMRLVRNFSLMLLGFTLFAAAICFVVSVFIANSISQPILALKDAVRQVGEEMTAPLERLPWADEEVRELEDAFDALRKSNIRNLHRVDEEKDKQNLFFNSATHQLKTPLTSIIGYSEIIQRMSRDEDVVMSAGYIEKAGKELLEVVEDIISISRFQKTEYDFTPEWFRLDELCTECLGLIYPRLQRSGIAVDNKCDPVEVFFDRQRVREVILNVLDNCIIHSGGSRISVSSAAMPLRLMIQDNGRGLDPIQIKRLFEPFYRPAKSVPGGSGLGLSICKGIMVAQGGDVEIDNAPGGGVQIALYFQDKTAESQPHHMARRI